MADWNYDDFGGSPDGGSVTQAVNWVGAVMSLVLIAGLTTWGWKLLVRDVTGVPVVRALEGPMRVAPADPGGDAAEFQGLAVNRIAAEEGQPEAIAEVRLAPAPQDLADEDVPMGDLVAAQEAEAAEVEEIFEVLPAPVFGAGMQTAEAIEPKAQPSATDLAVAAALAGIDDLQPIPASLTVGAGPMRSPRPPLRPTSLQLASYTPPADAAVLDERDPATVPAGTRLVQLGAYGSIETARVEWANAMSLFGNYMVGKERVIQEAETGGRKFYRLRAYGFTDLDDARQFCSVLVAEGANCIPVVQQ